MRDFQHSVNVLIKAYMNGTLVHGSCHACAVGNLVADACGVAYRFSDTIQLGIRPTYVDLIPEWDSVFTTVWGDQDVCLKAYKGESKRQIDATGYQWTELARIEKAFETAAYETKYGPLEGDAEFNGLVAVFNVLADIHQVDLTTRNEALQALEASK